MKLWETRPMPAGERKALTLVVVVVWVIALAMNVGHVADHLRALHFATTLALTPDFLLLIGVWVLRYRPKAVVAWLALVFGLAWLVWAGLSTTEPDASHRIIALAPIGVAVVATLLLEFEQGRPAPDATPPTVGRVPATARPARPRRTKPVPEPTVSTLLPADAPLTDKLPVLPPTPKEPVSVVDKPTGPSREQARAILLRLDDLDAVSNGQLSRTHGRSDVWWGQRKAAVRGELDAGLAGLGSELSTEIGHD